MSAPRISVIITCYNLEDYIVEAIESVLAQDVDEPVEIVIVDDCSTDSSGQLIAAYGHAKVVTTRSNSGVLLAMQAGLDAATGELIFLLDGDDRWSPSKLRKMVDDFDTFPTTIMNTHDLRYIDAKGNVVPKPSRVHAVMRTLHPSRHSDAIRNGIRDVEDFIWLGSALGFRRSIADLPGFHAFVRSLPDARNTYQDWPLALWLATRPGDLRIGFVDEQLFDYRLHGGNHSGDARTVDRTLRNLTRALNTVNANLAIAAASGIPFSATLPLRRHIDFLTYQIALYSGRRWESARGFVRSAGHLARRRGFAKEIARFLGVQFLGPKRFVARLSKRAKS